MIKGRLKNDVSEALFIQPTVAISANQIDEAGAEDICQGVNQEKTAAGF